MRRKPLLERYGLFPSQLVVFSLLPVLECRSRAIYGLCTSLCTAKSMRIVDRLTRTTPPSACGSNGRLTPILIRQP